MDPTTAVTALAAVLTLQAVLMLIRRPDAAQALRVLFWVTVTVLAYTRQVWLAYLAGAFLVARMVLVATRRSGRRGAEEEPADEEAA